MEIGVSTACFYPLETEKSLEKLLKADFKCFEMFANTFSEIEKPFISEIKSKLQFYNARISSMHPFTCLMEPLLFFSNYDRRMEDGIELYKKYFNAMNELEIDKFIFHGQIKSLEFHKITNEEYFERYHKLYNVAKSFGIKLCQENIRTCRNGKIDFIKQMKAYLKDDVAFTFDIKQADIEKENPYEMMRAMGDKIAQVHISDRNDTHSCLLPGDGERDFKNIINELKSLGYDDTVIIEVYSDCFTDINQVKTAKKLLKHSNL